MKLIINQELEMLNWQKNQVSKYLLPSSCSNYGRIKTNQIADETFSLNPLTDYSKANSMAEFENFKYIL